MKVFVASPYRGLYSHIQNKNIEYARKCCRAVVDMGHTPFAPHLHDTQFLNDLNPHERAMGLKNGRDWMKSCDIVLFFEERGTSDGVRGDLAHAQKLGKPVYKTSIGGLKETLRQIYREQKKDDENGISGEAGPVHKETAGDEDRSAESQREVRERIAEEARQRLLGLRRQELRPADDAPLGGDTGGGDRHTWVAVDTVWEDD